MISYVLYVHIAFQIESRSHKIKFATTTKPNHSKKAIIEQNKMNFSLATATLLATATNVSAFGTIFNEDYFTGGGDVGFGPLGLAPTDEAEFYELPTNELQNGLLAMLGFTGIVAEEFGNDGEEIIFVNLGWSDDR